MFRSLQDWSGRVRKTITAWEPEHWFACLALFFGLLFIIFTPPQKGSDEWAHFFRAYQVSNFHIMAQRNSDGSYGGMLPRTMISTNVMLTNDNVLHYYDYKYQWSETTQALKYKLHPRDRAEADFTGAASYSPIPYLGAALFMEPFKLLNAAPVVLIYAGRLGTLLVWILLMMLAIRFTPIAKWAFVALGLIPVALFQASMISADGATNGIACLFMALTLRFWMRREAASRNELLAYAGLLAALALAKPTYSIIAVLVLLVPTRRFGPRYARAKQFGLILLAAGVAFTWMSLVRPIQAYAIAHTGEAGIIISQERQTKIIKSNPAAYTLLMLDNTITTAADPFYESALGELGSYDIPLPIWLDFWVALIITIALLSLKPYLAESDHVLVLKRLFVIGVLVLNVLLILTGLYIACTPIGWGIVYGMQGRYYIALLPLLIPLALNRAPLLTINPLRLQRFVVSSYTVILMVSVVAVYFRYYVDARIPLLGT
jgi:uncharacterized membrane protein